jgi:hypothetical protein
MTLFNRNKIQAVVVIRLLVELLGLAITAMVDSTVGMVGDLHGIIGQAVPVISASDDSPMIEGKAA